MKHTSLLAAALAAAVGFSAQAAVAADGEKVFRRCQACHALEPGKHKVGPSLHGVIGRTAGAAEGYRYSAINEAAGEAGLVWTEETIVEYLPDPQGYLESHLEAQGEAAQGRTKMSYRLRNEEDARAVVEYIKQQSQ